MSKHGCGAHLVMGSKNQTMWSNTRVRPAADATGRSRWPNAARRTAPAGPIPNVAPVTGATLPSGFRTTVRFVMTTPLESLLFVADLDANDGLPIRCLAKVVLPAPPRALGHR